MNFVELVKEFLPATAQLLTINKPTKGPAILFADLDGDELCEITAAYRYNQQNYIIIIKNFSGHWSQIALLLGTGYNITYLGAYPLTSSKTNNLIVGWQIGSIWSELNIFKLMQSGFTNIVTTTTTFSKIDIFSVPNKTGKCSGYKIALWLHDTSEAYNVEIYSFINGKFIADPATHPYYFKKVAKYYQTKVIQYPDAVFYWYHLADALLKANMIIAALSATNKALSLPSSYPYYREILISLKKEIMSKIKIRNINLYPAVVKTVSGNKWGFIDVTGNFIITPKYDYAMDFQNNGLAVVEKDNLQGLINTRGQYVIAPKYQNITQFSEGLASIVDSQGFKVIDEKGNVLTTKSYDYIGIYLNNRAMFGNTTTGSKYLYGYLDKQGSEIIPAKYELAYDFNNSVALVKIRENEFALIDTSGKVLKSYKHYFVGPLSDSMLSFSETATGKYGYLNINGEIVISPKYTSSSPFEHGRAVVNTAEDFKSKYGLIDKTGNFILLPKYNLINFLGENRFAVGLALDESKQYLGSKFSISDMNGNLLTNFIYNDVSQYNEGFASAYDNTNTFFINKTGKISNELPIIRGNGGFTFDGTLIKALIDIRLSYLDKTGKIIFSQNKIIPLPYQYKVIEEKFKPTKDYLVYYPQINGMKNKTIQDTVNKELKSLSLVNPNLDISKLDYSYTGDFSGEFTQKDLLILKLDGYNFPVGAAHGMPTMVYPHINLINGRFYNLQDLFKQNSNYVKIISDIIAKQIKDDPQYSYVFPDSYKAISADQSFYLNGDTLFIYFIPYEIAPYAAGFPTFKISFKEIMSIINTQGEFWKSFN